MLKFENFRIMIPSDGRILAIGGNVPAGEILGLRGASGIGKSTLLRSIAGLYPHVSGRLLLNNRPFQNLPAQQRRVGLLFQSPALLPHLDVEENVALGLNFQPKTRNWPKKQKTSLVKHWLEHLGLSELAKRDVNTLSGGEKQRVCIARLMVIEPIALLLDEPFSGIDPDRRTDIMKKLKMIIKERALPTIIVSHHDDELLGFSDRIMTWAPEAIELNF